MRKIHTLLLALFLSATPLAYADHDGMGEHCKMHTQKTFEEADANKDGVLDKEEAKAACKMDFAKMDTDKNGTLSKEELNACGRHKHDHHDHALHEKRTQEFNAADKDNDGTLDREEAKKLPRVFKNFDAIDVDKDGTVDRDEVHEYMHRHKAK